MGRTDKKPQLNREDIVRWVVVPQQNHFSERPLGNPSSPLQTTRIISRWVAVAQGGGSVTSPSSSSSSSSTYWSRNRAPDGWVATSDYQRPTEVVVVRGGAFEPDYPGALGGREQQASSIAGAAATASATTTTTLVPVPVGVGFVNTRNKVATVTLHTAEHGVPGVVRTPLGVVIPVNSINPPATTISHHMGVCTDERPVMHWHQSARFLGPPRERSPDLTNACQLNSSSNSNNNNIINPRTCISCTDTCEHSLKLANGPHSGQHTNNHHHSLLGVNHHIYSDSCHSFDSVPDRLIADRPNYFADLNRSDCSDSSSVLNSCIQLKSEPPGGPSSPESSNELPPSGLDECAGCDMPIQELQLLSGGSLIQFN
ncbi:uncharacterized protein LOC125959367 [Anopheles darlingi]|uniref:uncharacterized protein LOC125959367 n=1 Tax=Anopheles darlingi TaxID=43151 RepID=UPI00210058F3|nr:uncharacterized protein LOC125959367 [Anopheles darlingi]